MDLARTVHFGGNFVHYYTSGFDSGSAFRKEFCTKVYESFGLAGQSGVWEDIGNWWKLLVVVLQVSGVKMQPWSNCHVLTRRSAIC